MGKRARRRAREAPLRARLGAQGTGDRFGPLLEAWMLDGPLAELAALYEAESPGALQRVLVIPGQRSDTLPDDALWAFQRAHGHDPSGLLESVVLATTNHRWSAIARVLLDRLTGEGVLDDDAVDRLAATFLDDDAVGITVPGPWVADFYLQRRGQDLGRLDPAKTYTLTRRVSPQVRRWAAGRRAERDGVARVLRRTRGMDSKHAAATVQGLVDVAEQLDDAEADALLELAADWPATAVRLMALKHLAARGRHAEALRRAAADRAATVRRWAASNRQASLLRPDRSEQGAGGSAVEPRPPTGSRPAEQPSLFA
ncbi:MAG TPA: hypothetical protein VM324_01825 [Egibacteraceae bacterium]|jgi:hypothetical protein|nr:hypothetical protein [Egibacteraceae bacterium]